MKIIHIASECAPFAKSGGLGDVVYGLSRMMQKLGHPSEVIVPNYLVSDSKIEKKLFDTFSIKLDGETFDVLVYLSLFHDITVYSIDSTHSKNLFKRQKIYGEQDDVHRFLCFNYFALSFLNRGKIPLPDVLHLHDWPTGFCSAFLKFCFPDLNSKIKAKVLTIHNLKHHGITKKDHLSYFEFPIEKIPSSYLQEDNQSYLNIKKAAIEEANHCVVVSPTYLKEIQTPLCGEGLQDFITQRIKKFSAILNGIDTEYWNPEKDLYLHRNFRSQALIDEVIEEKYRNKHFLQKHLCLAISHEPLFIFITRLVDQKAPHLILEAIKHIEKNNAQAVLLGSDPEPALKSEFEKLRGSKNIYIDFRFQESLSHLCYAAADAIVVPSIFEPCGLTQMIAMRYGTIPIVRKTGGLSDTVFDVEHSNVQKNYRNGFVFEYPTLDSMDYIINRACKYFREEKENWNKLIKSCLSYDFSFKKAASEYLKIYSSLCT